MKRTGFFTAALLFLISLSVFAQTAQTRLDNGKKLFDQGNYSGAMWELYEAIRLNPNMAEAYAYLARSFNGIGDYDHAIPEANKAIQLNPMLAVGYYARGNAYQFKNDCDRAIADYTQAIRLNPNYTDPYYSRAFLYYSNKKYYDLAIADLTQVIRLDPNYAFAYINRGNAYKNKKDYNRAIADYTEAIRLAPNNVMAYSNMGDIYFQLYSTSGNINDNYYNLAQAYYQAALKIDPNYTAAITSLSALYETRRSASKPNSNAPALVTDQRPYEQKRFEDFFPEYARQFDMAQNELQESVTRVNRKKALGELKIGPQVNGWIGTVKDLGTNSDGDAYISIRLNESITVQTYNNALSDLLSSTLIPMGSSLYQKLLYMSKGQKVRFSGSFLYGKDDYYEESSITIRGSMKQPDFIMRFSSIEPIN